MALEVATTPAESLFQEALSRHQQGELALAESLYGQVLALQPRHAGALHLAGVLALGRGDPQRARELLSQSVRINANVPQVHMDLGNALHSARRLDEALSSYSRATALKPDFLEALFNKTLVLQQLGRHEEALRACEQALRLQPNFVNALLTRALLLAALRRHAEALAAYDDCLQRLPAHGETLNNRGVLLLDMDRLEEALASFDRAAQLAERPPGVISNRGVALLRLGRLEEAERAFAHAVGLEPDNYEAHFNRANALRKLQRREEALQCFDAALAVRPDSNDAFLGRAETLAELGRYSDAAGCLIKLSSVVPQKDYALGLRVYLQSVLCNWEGYQTNVQQLVKAVKAGRRAAFPFSFLSVSDSAIAQLRCARTFVNASYPGATSALHRGESYGHDKIRVAYLSGDFRDHPVSTLLAGVVERHDRERFESVAISLRPAEDSPMGRRMQAAFDHFIAADKLGTAEIATLIREREIDILVDLMGFTSGCKTEVLALRPAPVQVSWLGFPGTMGAGYIDYTLADSWVVPRERLADYGEKIVWMPGCFQPNDRQRPMAPTPVDRREHSLPETGIVFCSFNNQYKLTPEMFAVWMRILREVSDSVLWVFVDEAAAAENLRNEATRHGVAAERLVFAPRASYPDHLARLRCADLFLDTFPFNGGASTSDALWAGLPVLTLTGEALAARMAGSLLRAVGIPELVSDNIEDYANTAITLARTPGAFAALRARLTEQRETAALFDSARFARHLERAFTFMRDRTERGKRPASFSVAELESPGPEVTLIGP